MQAEEQAAGPPDLDKLADMLDQLKDSDPDAYASVMAQLTLGAGGSAPGQPGQPNGSLVSPTPGFVVKTSAVKDSKAADGSPAVPAGGKVFINITSADAVAPMVTRQTLDKDGREQEALNIPLSMGPLRADQDKSGNDCAVLDVIVNPGVVADSVADSSGHFRHFVVELALQYSERKHGLKLSMEYKIPKMQYKGKVGGEVVPQWLRKPKSAPGIQALDAKGAGAAASNTNAAALGALESGGAVVPASKSTPAPAAPAPTHGTFRRHGGGMDLRTGEESKGTLDKIAEGVQGGSSDDHDAETTDSAKHVAKTIRQQSRDSSGAKGPLIQELNPGEEAASTKHLNTEHTTAAATGMAPRRSRKLAAGPKPVAAPLVFAKAAVSLLFDPPAGAIEGAPARCEAWSYDKWDLIPLNYKRASAGHDVPFAVRVTWQCDAAQPQLMTWATALRRRVEAAAPAGGRQHTTLASLPSLRVGMGEETVSLALPGHRETTTALPVVLDVARLGRSVVPATVHSGSSAAAAPASVGRLGVSVDIAAAVVTLTIPVSRIDPEGISGPDPGSRPWLVAAALDGGDDASAGGSAVDVTSVAAARYKGGSANMQAAAAAAAAARAAAAANARAEGPVGEDEELPEDKFHKSDAMSQHYLAQRAQAAAEAEAKRAANARPDPYEGLDFKARVVKAAAELVAKAESEGGDSGGGAAPAELAAESDESLVCLERVFQLI